MQTHYVIGEGKQVTTIGLWEGKPAVFLKPALNPNTVPGQVITDGVDAIQSDDLEEDEIVFTFPSEEHRDRFYCSLFDEDVGETLLLNQRVKEINWDNDVMAPGIVAASRFPPKVD